MLHRLPNCRVDALAQIFVESSTLKKYRHKEHRLIYGFLLLHICCRWGWVSSMFQVTDWEAIGPDNAGQQVFSDRGQKSSSHIFLYRFSLESRNQVKAYSDNKSRWLIRDLIRHVTSSINLWAVPAFSLWWAVLDDSESGTDVMKLLLLSASIPYKCRVPFAGWGSMKTFPSLSVWMMLMDWRHTCDEKEALGPVLDWKWVLQPELLFLSLPWGQ